MVEVLLRRLNGAAPEAERAAALALAGRVARERGRRAGALQLAALSGAALAWGRDQEAPPGALRRLSGGHAVRCGSGVLALRILLPGPAAWLDQPLPRQDRLLNRYVRGLLAALRALGFDASYPGRDVVRARGGAVAALGCERDAQGVSSVEAFVGVTASLAPPLLADRPEVERSPLASAAPLFAGGDGDAALGRVAEAIAAAYARRHALRFALEPPDAEEQAAAGAELARPAAAAEAWAWGPVRAIPIGTLRAAVRIGAGGELAAVRFASEWMADSVAVAALARALEGARFEPAVLLARVAPVIGDPAHGFLGLDAPESIVRAVLEAGERAPAGSAG